MAKDSVKGKEDDWRTPVRNANNRFYGRLNQAAKSTGLTRIEVLEQGRACCRTVEPEEATELEEVKR